jgi:hypothetical protein
MSLATLRPEFAAKRKRVLRLGTGLATPKWPPDPAAATAPVASGTSNIPHAPCSRGIVIARNLRFCNVAASVPMKPSWCATSRADCLIASRIASLRPLSISQISPDSCTTSYLIVCSGTFAVVTQNWTSRMNRANLSKKASTSGSGRECKCASLSQVLLLLMVSSFVCLCKGTIVPLVRQTASC